MSGFGFEMGRAVPARGMRRGGGETSRRGVEKSENRTEDGAFLGRSLCALFAYSIVVLILPKLKNDVKGFGPDTEEISGFPVLKAWKQAGPL